MRWTLTLLLCVGVAACHRNEPLAPPPAPGVVTANVSKTREPPLERRGVVASNSRLRLGFNAPGVLAQVNVRTGDVVRTGQLLARLKNGDAAAALRIAEAQRGKAQRDFGSTKRLSEAGALPSAQQDDARSNLQVANANSAFASESLAQRKLVSPIDGTVLSRLAEPGETVGPGSPVLVLEETERMVVRVGVTERELARLKRSQSVSLEVDGTTPRLAARVRSLTPAPLGDGLYAVEVYPTTPSDKGSLHPGMLVTVRFLDEATTPEIRVPLDAIVHREKKTGVFVIDGEAASAKVRLREVDLGAFDGNLAIVLGGLREGERIVREGSYFLHDGDTVRLLDETHS
jgi:RND family efflux transporter MFP subunit